MQFSSLSKPISAVCFALAIIVAGLANDRPASAALPAMNSVVGDLSDFYTNGNSGTLDIEKNGQTMEFTFGSNMTINGRPWMSGGMRSEDWGAQIPSSLKLHCTLVRVYYSGRTATALKTISSGGSRFFC